MINSKHFHKENSKPLNLYLKIAVIKGNCVPMICVLWILNLRKQFILKYFVAMHCLFWGGCLTYPYIKSSSHFLFQGLQTFITILPFHSKKKSKLHPKIHTCREIDWTSGFDIHKACTS